MNKPKASIIMPSYNTPRDFLREAVNSVLSQTYGELELIIIDDGSAVPVRDAIADIDDRRIMIVENPGNKGLPFTLNNGIAHCSGKYIFRMDSDDICEKNRIERQVGFFEAHPEIDVTATFSRSFGDYEVLYRSPSGDAQIKAGFLWKNELVHPTVGLKAETVKKYDVRYRVGAASEDYELWTRMAFEYNCKFAVIPEELLRYRMHGGQVTKNNSEKLQKSELEIIERTLKSLDIALSGEQLAAYGGMRTGQSLGGRELSEALSAMKQILSRLPAELDKTYLKKLYRRQALKYCLKNKRLSGLPKVLGI